MAEQDEKDKFLSEEEEAELLEAAAKLEQEQELERERVREELALAIQAKWKDRGGRRAAKEAEWLESTRLYLGSLSIQKSYGRNPDRPFETKALNSRPDFNIVRTKCDIAIAQCVSMQFAGGEKNWDLEPAPNEAGPDVQVKCENMELEIDSQLKHCDYGRKTRRAIEDRIILGTGVLKGPTNTGKLYTRYEEIPGTGVWEPVMNTDYSPNIEWVNPWFFYPDDTINDPCAVQDAIEVHPMSALELKKLMLHKGFDASSIARVLVVPPEEYTQAAYSEYASLTDTNPYLFTNKYTVLEYHGPITETQLGKLDITPSYDSANGEYYGEVWVCQGEVIRIQLENIEASYEIPYAISVWKKDPATIFGFGAPQLSRDAQRVVTETWHMILDNASVSSGPQAAMQKQFLEPADGVWEIEPRKIWYMTDPMQTVQGAIQFFNVPNVIGDLMPVLQAAREFAEEETGTPLLAGGMNSPQNADSATGQLILQQNSTTLLDFMSEDWDDYVTEKVIRRMYAWNMQYNPKPEIKGNFQIDVRSSTEYKNKQTYIRDLERLSVEASQNPETAKYVNLGEVMRTRLNMMTLPHKGIIRSPEEVAQIEQQQAQQPDPGMIELQLKQMDLELRAKEAQLKEAQLAFEMNQQQQREKWEHDEKMSANYARTVESEASVLKSQNEKEIELLRLAQRDEEAKRKIDADIFKTSMNTGTQKFLKGLEETRKAREQLLKEDEMEYAKKHGKGI